MRAFVNDQWWQEVVVLAYGLADDSVGLFDSLADSDLGLLARGVMDEPKPDVVRQQDVVERAAAVIERGGRGQASAFEALAVVWTDDAIRRIGTAIRSETQAADFVERFARDPYSVASRSIVCTSDGTHRCRDRGRVAAFPSADITRKTHPPVQRGSPFDCPEGEW